MSSQGFDHKVAQRVIYCVWLGADNIKNVTVLLFYMTIC